MTISPVVFRNTLPLPAGRPQSTAPTPQAQILFGDSKTKEPVKPSRFQKGAAVLTVFLSTLLGAGAMKQAAAMTKNIFETKTTQEVSSKETQDTPREALSRATNVLVSAMLVVSEKTDELFADLASNLGYFQNITLENQEALEKIASDIVKIKAQLKEMNITPNGIVTLGKEEPSAEQIEGFKAYIELLRKGGALLDKIFEQEYVGKRQDPRFLSRILRDRLDKYDEDSHLPLAAQERAARVVQTMYQSNPSLKGIQGWGGLIGIKK